MAAWKYTFTIFTATYNRAHTLHRVYESLRAQTFGDFEWLIVDDGSTDGTKALVRQWQSEADFPVRYIWQENGGKHIAVNRGVQEARGEFFLNIDSDNACPPVALERFKFHWESIPADQREEFTGVCALARDSNGNILGTRFPFDPTDCSSLEIGLKYDVKGEKGGFHRTEVMRQVPYPTFEGETVVPDSFVSNRISARYKTRFVNEPLKIYYNTPNSRSSNRTRGPKNPKGMTVYYRELVNLDCPFPMKKLLRAYVQYVRYSCHAGFGLGRQIKDVRSPAYWLSVAPIGYLLFLRDKMLVSS